MLFVPQKHIYDCGVSIMNFILLNSNQKSNKYYYNTTKYMNISTLSILLSNNLVENCILFCGKTDVFEFDNKYRILHITKLGFGHYIMILDKKEDKLLVFDPSSVKLKYIKEDKIRKKWTGYMIVFNDLNIKNSKKNVYIPLIIRLFFKLLILIFFLCFVYFHFN